MQNLESLVSGNTIQQQVEESSVFTVGSRVRVTSYSPFRGLRGTIHTVNTIPHSDEPFCFYHIELEGAHIKEPIWFEQDEVESVSP